MQSSLLTSESVNVVLIEGNLGDARLLRQMGLALTHPSIALAHARSLEEGRATIEASRPDAVLLDLDLPECRGVDALRRVRAFDDEVPIVVLTGTHDEALALAVMHEGAQDYLVKGTFDEDVLGRTLRYAIARDRQARLYREAQRSRARTEKLEAIGRFSAGVVQDFNKLLNVVQTHVALLRRSDDSHVREHAQSIHAAVQEAATLTDQLLAFSRGRTYRRTTIDLSELAIAMQPVLRRLLGDDIHLAVEAPPDPVYVIADRGQLEQVVLNLVVNARDAVGPHGAVRVRTETLTAQTGALSGKMVGALRVSDDGPGMDERVKARMFEPFFTTKEDGHGLGLATVFGIVQQCSGSIDVKTAKGAGTEFCVLLPAPPMSSQRFAAVRPPSLQPVPDQRRVLLIEDDDMLRDVVSVALQQVGYEVLTARNGVEAMALADTRGRDIQCIVTDISLPGRLGTQLAPDLAQRCPGVPILFVSGWAGHDGSLPDLGVPTAFLAKPFSSRDLLRALDALRAQTTRVVTPLRSSAAG